MPQVIAIVGLVAAVAGGAINAKASIDQAKAQEKAGKENRAITGAQSKTNATIARRKAIRQQRILAAKIEQSSENTGVAGSSGEISSVGNLGVSLAANVAASGGRQKTSDAVGAVSQTLANATSANQKVSAFGSLLTGAGSLAVSAGDSGLFKKDTSVEPEILDFSSTPSSGQADFR